MSANAIASIGVLSALLLGLSLSCGTGSRDGIPVSGRVTLDDRPLANASLLLIPEGSVYAQVTARIVDGAFVIDQSFRLSAGEYDVCIMPAEPEFEEVAVAEVQGKPSPLRKIRIPEKYTKVGALRAVIPPEGRSDLEFRLTSE